MIISIIRYNVFSYSILILYTNTEIVYCISKYNRACVLSQASVEQDHAPLSPPPCVAPNREAAAPMRTARHPQSQVQLELSISDTRVWPNPSARLCIWVTHPVSASGGCIRKKAHTCARDTYGSLRQASWCWCYTGMGKLCSPRRWNNPRGGPLAGRHARRAAHI